jgi:predicted  nucleic acid-binding Zn-ribbon protein
MRGTTIIDASRHALFPKSNEIKDKHRLKGPFKQNDLSRHISWIKKGSAVENTAKLGNESVSPIIVNESQTTLELNGKRKTLDAESEQTMPRPESISSGVTNPAMGGISIQTRKHVLKTEAELISVGKGDLGNSTQVIDAAKPRIARVATPCLISIQQRTEAPTTVCKDQADQVGLPKTIRRIEKPKQTASSKRTAHPKVTTPTVNRAMEILQWAWEEEKTAIQTSHNLTIGKMQQLLAQSQETAATLRSEAEGFEKETKTLRESLRKLDLKLDTLSESYKIVKISNQGLGRDVEKARKDCMDSYEKLNSIVREYKDLKSQHDLAQRAVQCLENDLSEIKASHKGILAECHTRVQQTSIENANLESKLEAKDILIVAEKGRVLSLQRELEQQETLKTHLESLVNTYKDQLVTKLNDAISTKRLDGSDTVTMESLRRLLKDMHSNRPISHNLLEQFGSSLEALQNRYNDYKLARICKLIC